MLFSSSCSHMQTAPDLEFLNISSKKKKILKNLVLECED